MFCLRSDRRPEETQSLTMNYHILVCSRFNHSNYFVETMTAEEGRVKKMRSITFFTAPDRSTHWLPSNLTFSRFSSISYGNDYTERSITRARRPFRKPKREKKARVNETFNESMIMIPIARRRSNTVVVVGKANGMIWMTEQWRKSKFGLKKISERVKNCYGANQELGAWYCIISWSYASRLHYLQANNNEILSNVN